MAYFNKQQIINYIEEQKKECSEKQGKFLTPPNQTISQIDNDEDIVGLFWILQGSDKKPIMNGKAFVRIDDDIYTDDRYALDSIQAQNENKTIAEIIKERESGTK